MKKVVVGLILLLSEVSLSAQDIITKRTGEDIKVKITEVLENEVKYKSFDYLDGPIYSLRKSDIIMIRYENGINELITAQERKRIGYVAKNEGEETTTVNNDKKARFGIYAGFTTESNISDIRKEQIDNGWEYNMPVGGHAGIELKIPVVAGLYIKPGLYGEYSHAYGKYDSTREYDGNHYERNKKGSVTRVPIHYTSTTHKSQTGDAFSASIPLSIGYMMNVGNSWHFSLAALGFASLAISNKNTAATEQITTSSPFYAELNTHKKSEDTVDVLENSEFKDRISYGIGAEAEVGIGSFYLRYRMLHPLNNTDVIKSYIHNASVGLYF